MLSCVEHETSFTPSGPGNCVDLSYMRTNEPEYDKTCAVQHVYSDIAIYRTHLLLQHDTGI